MFETRVGEQDATHPGYANAWAGFRAALLRHGGRDVVPPTDPDPLIEMLGEQGAVVPESTTQVLDPGERSDCHANAVALWRKADVIAIGTGYALSGDLLWREHSWAWDRHGRLVETTETRTRYFGVRMDGAVADWFANWIAPASTGEHA
jgi:hypothetical protein